MLTINQTATQDNKVIFLMKIILNGSILYICNRSFDFTLEGITFKSARISYNPYQTQKSVDISNGGGLGTLGNSAFTLTNWSDSFISNFAPFTSKPSLVSCPVQYGFVWEGATLLSQITWYFSGHVQDYNYTPQGLNLTVFEIDDFENDPLPPYAIQKTTNDGISYYPDAPEDNVNKSIPIVYGDLFQPNTEAYEGRVMPLVSIAPDTYLLNSHKCYSTTDDRIFELISDINARMGIKSFPYTYNQNGTVVKIDSGYLSGALGFLKAYPRYFRKSTNAIGNLQSITEGNFMELPIGEWAQFWSLPYGGQTSDNGLFNDDSPVTTANLKVYVKGEFSDSEYTIEFGDAQGGYFLTPQVVVPGASGTHSTFALRISAAQNLADYLGASFDITNTGSHGYIQILNVYLEVNNIQKIGMQTRKVVITPADWDRIMTGDRRPDAIKSKMEALINPQQGKFVKDNFDGNNIFGTGYGRAF